MLYGNVNMEVFSWRSVRTAYSVMHYQLYSWYIRGCQREDYCNRYLDSLLAPANLVAWHQLGLHWAGPAFD